MSTERLPPMDPNRSTGDTKATREEKQKVEKVREIDADEETQRRRKKFQMLMGDEDAPVDLNQRAPSPFETEFYATAIPSVEPGQSATAGSATAGGIFGTEDFSETENAIVPSPSYSPPPNVSAPFPSEDMETDTGDLPQSSDFWDDMDFPPDQPLQSPQYQESPQSAARSNSPEQPENQVNQPAKKQTAPGKAAPAKPASQPSSPFGPPGKTIPSGISKPDKQTMGGKNEKPPFFSPEKSSSGTTPLKTQGTEKGSTEGQIGIPPVKKEKGAPAQTTPSGKIGKISMPGSEEEEKNPSASYPPPISIRTAAKEKPSKSEEEALSPAQRYEGPVPIVSEDPEGGGGGRRDRGDKDQHQVEIVSPSLPTLPVDVQPMAQTAATQAAPYLRPETLSLFYQMVGTIYVMTASPTGINRTEITLNNPAFADSKFYGTTITIEKYATAPDSLNIKLTGSDRAVSAFKENIPSLMNAFNNGNFTFRVNRVDAEYAVVKPYFRRKEKGEGGESGGSLGDRRK